MSLIKDNYISAAEIVQLNESVREECLRRNLNNPLTPPPVSQAITDSIIAANEIYNLLQALTPLDAFPSTLDVSSYIAINQSEKRVVLKNIQDNYIKPLEIVKDIVATAAKTTDKVSNSDCRGTCAGLCTGCTGTCTGTCDGCSGTCSGGCYGGCAFSCGGCGGCSGGCSFGCSSCGGLDGAPAQCPCATGGCAFTMA